MSALIEHTLFGVRDRVQCALDRFKMWEPPQGYHLAFSGGKDSQCIYHLAKESGVKFRAVYRVTTIDPPEVLRFIKRNYPDVVWDRPEMGMMRLIAEKKGFPPLRQARWCCQLLKERSKHGQFTVTGIRWAESKRREQHKWRERNKKGGDFLHPIIDWPDEAVWEYLNLRGIPHCELYDQGFRRIGCIMCPQGGQERMKRDAERWPKYAQAYIRALDKALLKRNSEGKRTDWESGAEWFDWWIGQNQDDGDECQLPLFDN